VTRPNQKFIIIKLLIAIIFGVFFYHIIKEGLQNTSSEPYNQTKPANKKEPLFSIDKSEQVQSLRKDLLEGLIAEGVFNRIEIPASLVHVWVDSKFMLIDYKTKESFLQVVFCYYYDGNSIGDCVVLRDNLTGDRIGQYSPITSLRFK
jgi:hypothetical protein